MHDEKNANKEQSKKEEQHKQDLARNNQSSHDPQSNTPIYSYVFVNQTGQAALIDMRQPKFSVGSVIVREKLLTATATKPALLTVMIKHEAGFIVDNGDWEYLVMSGDGSQLISSEKVGQCQACHAKQKENDFVFRTYLSNDLKTKWK